MVAFLLGIVGDLESIDHSLAEASKAVGGADGNVRPLPSYIADVNTKLESIDGALKPVPGATKDISGSLVGMRGNLEKVDGSLETTSGSLTTTAGALSATSGSLSDTAKALVGTSTSLTDTASVLKSLAASLADTGNVLKPCTTSGAQILGVLRHTQSNPDKLGTENLWMAADETLPIRAEAVNDTGSIVTGLTDVNKHLKSVCTQVPPPPSAVSGDASDPDPPAQDRARDPRDLGAAGRRHADPHAAGHQADPQAGDGHHHVGVGDRPGHRLHRPDAGDQPHLGRAPRRLAAAARVTLEAMRGVTAGLAGKVDSILAADDHHRAELQRRSRARSLGARDTAAEINGSVKGIGQSLASILATLRSTQAAAGEINTSTKGIHAAVVALLPVTKAIDAGIATSNRGIAAAADFVVVIRADIGNILAGVPDLQKHARSIDCSPGLRPSSAGARCRARAASP